MQVVHDALAGLDGVRHHFHRGLGALLHQRVAGVAGDPGEIELQCGERSADIIMDLARDRGALVVHAGLQMLRQFGQPLARLRQLLVGHLARETRLVRVDRVFDGGRQAGEVGLEQVVAGAVAHGGHRHVLADLARDQDEGQRALERLDDVERRQAGKAGHVEIGQHDVPAFLERGPERRLGIDPGRLHLDAATAQMGHLELMVELGVLQVQHAQGGAAGWRGVGWHGASVAAAYPGARASSAGLQGRNPRPERYSATLIEK